jgi:uncharacterized iron-regulated protein
MTMPRLFAFLLAACALACAAGAQDLPALPLGDPARAFSLVTGGAGELYDARAGAPTEFEAMISDLAKADVVILAEHHATPPVQEMEARIFAALAAGGSAGNDAAGGAAALGMEFFDIEDDAALASFVSGQIDVGHMLARTGWYQDGGYPFNYYEPLLTTARQNKAPVYGLNIPSEWIKTIAKEGYGALGADQRRKIGEPAPPSDRQAYMMAQMMGMPGELSGSTLDVQRAWDGAMAESIRRAREKEPNRTIVAVVGVGHAAHGVGIPARLAEIAPDLTVRIVAPVIAEEPDPDAHVHPGYEPQPAGVFSRGYADYVYVLADDGGRRPYGQLGVNLEVSTRGDIAITKVRPGSIAERGGLRIGDSLLMVGEMAASSVDEVRRAFGAMEFGRVLNVVVRRPMPHVPIGVSIPMGIIVVPPTDGPSDWLTSEVSSSVLDDFDPLSSRAYETPDEPAPTGIYARLVSSRDRAERIDVFQRGRLIESWRLDEAGRPVLGLYADPTSDGTMRLEIDRDESGTVTATRRFDERGDLIETR